MNRAFLAVGVAFLAVGVASSTLASGVVWSTFVTLGVVFLAVAFALGGDGGEGFDEEPPDGADPDEDA